MRIIQIVSYYPPYVGGMQNVTKEISERLSKKGHQVEVFTSDIGCKKGKLKSTENLKIHYLKSCEFAHTPIIPSLFFELLKKTRDSIMHVHVAQAFVPEVVYLVSKIRKIPYIAHIHSDIRPSGKFGFLLLPYKKLIIKKILSGADKVICLSKVYKQFICKEYEVGEKKVIVIPNGVGKEFFIDKKEKLNKIINLLFVGRLSVEKNIPKLIKAVSLLKSKVILHIVGEGEKKAELEKLISDKKMNNVILHGKKTGRELISFYRHADIFLLASGYEGQPLTLLEAMASQTPIIASNKGGIREVIRNVGILVNPPTSKNFAKSINNLIEDKSLMDKLSNKGKKKAGNYNWYRIVEKFEDVYKKVGEKIQNNQ